MGLFKRKPKEPTIRLDFMDAGNDRRHQKLNDVPNPYTNGEQDYSRINQIFHRNGIAHKIVTKPAEDATRNGFRLVIPNDEQKQAVYQKKLDSLAMQIAQRDELIYQRRDGDAYVTYGIQEKDMTASSEPIDPKNIEDVTFAHAFGQANVLQTYTNDDPTDPNYGKENTLVVRQTSAGSEINNQGVPVAQPVSNKTIQIDKSRYSHISLDKYEGDLTGTSVISSCWDQLLVLDNALEATGKILREYEIKAFKSDAYFQLSKGLRQKFREKLEYGMDNESVLMLGSNEDIQKITSSLGGIDSLLTFAWQDLASACNIPKSVLTGEQAGTLSGATQDVANYYDNIKAIQEELLKPQLEQLVCLLFYAQNVGDGYENPDSIDWHIEFNPLYSPDDKTQSETTLNYANSANVLYTAGIFNLDQALGFLSSQGNNQIQAMQNIQADSADDFTPEEIEKYESALKKVVHSGSKSNQD